MMLNSKAINFVKNFSYTLASNLIALLVSTLVVLIVPKVIGVEEYGYWQLYLFYSSYVGFLHFGWNDGIYLKYGGKQYKDLDKRLFFSQFYMLLLLQIIILVVVFFVSSLIINDSNRMFIIQMTAICMLILNSRYMLLLILQATNKIKEYARITIMDRLLYCLLIITFLIIGIDNFKYLIFSDIIGKLLSFSYAVYCCRDIVFRNISSFYFSINESINNISVGIKLMLSNIASKLIIGIVRFGIERSWNVATFGKVSLTLSISSLLMLFINAVGIIMFPILRRTDDKKLPRIYLTMRDLLIVISMGALLGYYPFKLILSLWLPEYSDSMAYMALMFPMCIYEGKMGLLINTYLKTLRKEKLILKVNVLSLLLSLIITYITTVVMEDLDLAVVSIVVLLAFRSILAEIFLSKILKISVFKDIVFEVLMTIIFIFTSWFINSWFGVLIYTLTYVLYLIIKRKDIIKSIKNLRVLMKN